MAKVREIILLTRKEVADYLRCSIRTVDKIVNDKKFYGKIKIGRRVLIDKEILNEFIDGCYR